MLISQPGWVKPPAGTQFDWSHPFFRKLLFCVPFRPPGWFVSATLLTDPFPIIWGSTARRSVSLANVGSTAFMGSNREGVCAALAVDQTLNVGADPIPASQVTICVIRRKRDTTHRNPGLMFCLQNATTSEQCSVNGPFSDGVVYWNFGGITAGTTRLSKSGLSFSTTIPERWVFVAGSRGMAIWQNGVKVASHATANPGRTVDVTEGFGINGRPGTSSGDLQDYNYFAAYDEQWDDAMCRWWSAEPYAHLYPPLVQTMWALGAPGGGGGAGRGRGGGKKGGGGGLSILNPFGADIINIGNPGLDIGSA